ncbi:MAG: hypothetical protein B7Z73_09625 [Planctomycetia bacterium 21-64-5]|nr:MAG: hypothetical protein B7Z73_09625 [Planctomycetia bacterium 21-64-5]HQU45299.1 SH3 domain-containing protein [Pirellulales bacterium]
MTLRLAIAACIACCAAQARAEPFPYTTFVTASDAYLRSGPGEAYYPAARLRRGQQVEVVRHGPGGWCAVRPPEDAFSWVAAEFVEPRQGNIGVVTGNHVAVRVGSAFSNMRDVIQVRLNDGDQVEILEAQELESGGIARAWYKILPPVGEFRWIPAHQLDRQIEEPDENKHDRWVRQASHDGPGPGSAAKRGPRRAVPRREIDDEPEDDALASEEDDDGRVQRLRREERQPKADLKEEAEDLDLALSAMVAAEPPQWDLILLRREAEEAIERSETALERGRIRRVLRKIDKFADIQRRYLAVMDVPAGPHRSDRGVAGRAVETALPPLAALSPLRYDGVGRLTQLSSLDPRLPQFALVDATGRVSTYVSPAPGVNLRRYLNQDVGINGSLGYLPERQAQHLTAKRIVPMVR